MAQYTLTPESNHGVNHKDALRQLKYFFQASRNVKMSEWAGFKDLGETLKGISRWGVMETSTLANNARRHPDRLALVDDDGELTYAQWWDEVSSFARSLYERGVKEGSNVAVLAMNGRAAIHPLCSRHMIGYNIFMINANSSGPQIEKLLEFHDIDVLILDQEFLDRLEPETMKRDLILGFVHDEHARPEGIPSMAELIKNAPKEDRLPKSPKKGAHVVMTSGTTGMPKGVIRRTVKSPQGVAPVLATVPWERNQVVMLTGVLFHAYGWGNLMIGLMMAATFVTRRHPVPEQSVSDIEKYGITAMATSASRLRAIITYAKENGIDRIDGMKWITSSGSPLTPFEVENVNNLFGNVLSNFYGSTETSALALAPADELSKDPSLTGIVRPGTRVEIRDDEGNPVPEGEVGLIYAAAYDMFLGYTDPSIEIEHIDGMLRMGDRGYRKGDRLWVLGRADDLVITQFGEKIFPSELEDLLMRRPEVADVYVHGVVDEKYGQALRCYVIRAEGVGEEFDADTVRGLITDSLSDAHAPRDVFFVSDFPRNPMGKVMKTELPGKSTV